MDRIAKLQRRFLELLLFQVSFAAFDVFSLRFFRVGTATQAEENQQQETKEGSMMAETAALFFHLFFLLRSRGFGGQCQRRGTQYTNY